MYAVHERNILEVHRGLTFGLSPLVNINSTRPAQLCLLIKLLLTIHNVKLLYSKGLTFRLSTLVMA